ncbi:UDP-galactose transporter 1-like protein [Vairimorpha necatrix]|uniref:UDP-galactose transporter 1-like protein n=1 Tax=Vairimorpha necatrix TaxID=6039 RepID=A0AAX4J909_9MICR
MNEKSSSILFLGIGIYALFLINGIYQEKLATDHKNVKYSSALLPMFLQSLGGVLVSGSILNFKKDENSKTNRFLIFNYIFLSVLTLISAQLWTYSLKFLSYPTIVISKSCKLLSIALMNFIIYKKKFTMRKYFTLILTSFCVLLFALSETKETKNMSSSYIGICLLLINLSIDGFINVVQDNIVKKYKVSSLNMMYYFNLIRLSLSSVILITNGSFYTSFGSLIGNSDFSYDILLSSVTNVIGQVFIYSMIEKHGTLTLSIINIIRKMTSILMSFFIFGHFISFSQGFAIFGVLFSIYLDFNEKENKIKKY